MTNVLIVDDEKHVREAIRYFVPWDQYGVTGIYEASNGREAMELVQQHRPAVVFTDMRMPLVDGASLLEWLHSHAPYTKTVVVSGYQDFDYVKPAIVYGGTDYLLKPVSGKQVAEAAERAFELWNKEKNEREQAFRQKIQLNVLRPLYWDKALSDLVTGRKAYAELASAMEEELGLPSGAAACRMAIVSLQSAGGRLLRKLHDDVQLTAFAVANICNEILSRDRSGFAFRYWHDGADVALLLWSREPALGLLEEINRSMEAAYRMGLEIGLSAEQPFPDGIRLAFHQAGLALDERNLLGAPAGVQEFREAALPTENAAETEALQPLAERFGLALLTGDPERVGRALAEFCERLTGLPLLTGSVFSYWQEKIMDEIRRWLREWAGDGDARELKLPGYSDEAGNFSLVLWQRRLMELLTELCAEFRLSRTSDSRIVLEIRDYLDRNFERELTLQHIAERFYLSRENVSRKFKQVTGENLSDYLTRLRIDKAKSLIRHTDIRLSQVAERVGYEDEKYFSRVFKKATGLTPREYRKLGGADGAE
ncbi:helix-turn-helix domain-containing protein [Paenibacillus glufosinatiresistens]|uniref:helix-turn-helix domain-containing protein n=1 Tax=Paenibacillus glufosinatiresistens TaxID=3070657 RepID=UPI00286DCE7E|nr:helix-turn-helix domain-containing protein [Paenibacillus sp. YX.27]